MKESAEDVRTFFDGVSDEYSKKYSRANRFHDYFFNERLAEATRDAEIAGKRILDVGAGTGNLYSHLKSLDDALDYIGTDISAGMLANSPIPADRRMVGRIEDLDLKTSSFDLCFMLGVTTYLDEDELRSAIGRVRQLLADDGRFVVTFTNRAAIDLHMRRAAKWFARGLMPSRTVLGQKFTIYARTLPEVKELIDGDFAVEEVRYLNHTVFPVNHISRSLSVAAARRLHRTLRGRLLDRLSSDFLLILRKI